MVAIVSVGIGNVSSIKNMLAHIGIESELLDRPPAKNDYSTIILPGVGAFDNGMARLNNSGWKSWLIDTASGDPDHFRLLGICLGMQLLCDGSEEGSSAGLGLIPGVCKKFKFDGDDLRIKVPHMGWKTVAFDDKKVTWTKDLQSDSRFYFVHSYYYSADSDKYVIGTARHGFDFAAGIKNGSVMGFQFHPEKSHRFGKSLLREVVV